MNTNPDGTVIDRAAFLAQIGRGLPVKDIREHDVKILLFGDFAVIKARTAYKKPDGSAGAGWYTDDWQLRSFRKAADVCGDAAASLPAAAASRRYTSRRRPSRRASCRRCGP